MPRQRILRSTDVHRVAYVLVILLLVGALVDAHLAWYLRRPDGAWTLDRVELGDAAAAEGWPGNRIETASWPAPETWTRYADIGTTMVQSDITVESQPDQFLYTHHLQVERSGWPFACFERVEGFGGNPQVFVGSTLYHPLWVGLVLNAAFYATIIFCMTAGPLVAVVILRRLVRMGEGRCVRCGYPLGPGPVCTECGVTWAGDARASTGAQP
jgi:hypothetical protein